MRRYLRCLFCTCCHGVCELVGEHADTWECTECGSTYPATDDERVRYNEQPRGEELPGE